MVKLYENGAAAENLVSGFCKCGLYPFNPDAVYEKLPSRNEMSPWKALDESLLRCLQNMKEPQSAEEAVPKQNNRKRLDLEPRKSISTLDMPESDCDDSEDSSEVDDDLSSTDSNSDDSASNGNLSAKEDAIVINDIHVGDFAVVKYKYAQSVKYYVGECMRKDGN